MEFFRLLRDTEGGRAALHYYGSHSSSAKTTYISYFSGLVTKIFDRNKGGRKFFCLIITIHHRKQGMVEFLASGIRGWVLHNMVNQEAETKIRTKSGYLLQRPVLSDPLLPFRPHLLNNNQFRGDITDSCCTS